MGLLKNTRIQEKEPGRDANIYVNAFLPGNRIAKFGRTGRFLHEEERALIHLSQKIFSSSIATLNQFQFLVHK